MNSIERVYRDRSIKGPAKAIMAYLVYRANGDGECWPANSRIRDECGISEGTRKKHMRLLVEGGYISKSGNANGRGDKLTITVNPHYTKGVKFIPLNGEKGVKDNPLNDAEGGQKQPPSDSERGSNLTERGSNLKVEEQEEQDLSTEPNGSSERGRTPPRKTPAGAGDYEARWYDTTGYWLGTGFEDYLRERLGQDPRWQLVKTVYSRWRARGYQAKNVEGILDWYDEYRRDPNWEPPKRGQRLSAPAAANGSGPKTFDQQREENNRNAVDEFKRIIRQGAANG